MSETDRTHQAIIGVAIDHGFQIAKMVSIADVLCSIGSFLPGGMAQTAFDSFDSFFGREVIRSPENYSLLLCALSCYRNEPDEPPTRDKSDEYGLIAQFARRHYYKDAAIRLKKVFQDIKSPSGAKRADMKLFCNSRLSEKLFGCTSGLGSIGKNSLLINPILGSFFVIAGLLVDIRSGVEHKELPAIGNICGSCNACIDACPVGAIGANGKIDKAKCIQALTTGLTGIPQSTLDKWGYVIYGCDICQKVCPFNRDLHIETPCTYGEIGPALSLRGLLDSSADEMKALLRKSALGFSWIDQLAIRRNALIVSGNRKNPVMLESFEPYLLHPRLEIREIAEWATKKIISG